MPSVRIQDNIQLPANTYVDQLKEIEAGRGELRAGHAAGHGSARATGSRCPARRPPSRPSACRRPGSAEQLREEASFRGYTVVDPATVLTTHLTEVIKDNLAELLTYAETQKLLDELPQGVPEADRASWCPTGSASAASSACCRACSPSAISIRDLALILEAIGEAVGVQPEHRA